METQELTGRIAKCTYRHDMGGCKARASQSHRQARGPSQQDCYGEMGDDGVSHAPSSADLPFFEFRGEGSSHATEKCACGFYESAHKSEGPTFGNVCKEFKAGGAAEFDGFYCGCLGWS